MRRQQDEKLAPLATAHCWDVQWHSSTDEIPQDPTRFTLLVAHEFFDALPFNLIQVRLSPPWGRPNLTLHRTYRKRRKAGKKS